MQQLEANKEHGSTQVGWLRNIPGPFHWFFPQTALALEGFLLVL